MDAEITEQTCAKCAKRIETTWFARVHHGDHWAVYCSPECYISDVRIEQFHPWDDTNFMRNAAAFASPGAD